MDNKQLLKIFDPVENAMFVTTSRGEIVDASKVACALLGYTKKELLMKGRGDIFPPAVAAHLIEIA